jgi:hypothetical protein
MSVWPARCGSVWGCAAGRRDGGGTLTVVGGAGTGGVGGTRGTTGATVSGAGLGGTVVGGAVVGGGMRGVVVGGGGCGVGRVVGGGGAGVGTGSGGGPGRTVGWQPDGARGGQCGGGSTGVVVGVGFGVGAAQPTGDRGGQCRGVASAKTADSHCPRWTVAIGPWCAPRPAEPAPSKETSTAAGSCRTVDLIRYRPLVRRDPLPHCHSRAADQLRTSAWPAFPRPGERCYSFGRTSAAQRNRLRSVSCPNSRFPGPGRGRRTSN